MGYKPNLVTIAPSRTRTVPRKSVSKTGVKRTTNIPTASAKSFNYSPIEDRGIAVYNPITGETTWQTSMKPITKSKVVPEVTTFFPGKKVFTTPNKGFGDILGNVAVGAGSGALTGSVVPGWGTAVGAVVGGLSGLMKGLKNNKQEKLQEQAIANQDALQLAQQKRMDNAYMANYKPIQMNSMYANGGKLSNPTRVKIDDSKLPGLVGPNKPAVEIPSAKEINDWNTYLTYFNNKTKTEGVTPESLDLGNGNYSKKSWDDYYKGSYDYDTQVKRMQSYFTGIHSSHDPVAQESLKGGYFNKPAPSKIDGRIGSITLQQSIPKPNLSRVIKDSKGNVIDNGAYMTGRFDPNNANISIDKNSMYWTDPSRPGKKDMMSDKDAQSYYLDRKLGFAANIAKEIEARKWANNPMGLKIQQSNAAKAAGKPNKSLDEEIRIYKEGLARKSTIIANKANGGEINNVAIPNRNAIPINSKAEVVVNNQGTTTGSHETGQNIPVVNEQGQQTANVEPGEVVMTTSKGQQYALSARLGFAEKYQMMNDMIDKANARLKVEKNLTKRTTITRNIDKVKRAMDMLPQQQEATKQKMGIGDTPQKAWSGINLNLTDLNNFAARKNATDEAARLASMGVGSDPLFYSSDNPSGYTLGIGQKLTPRIIPSVGGAPAPSSLGETGFLNNKLEGVGGVAGVAQMALPFITNAINNRTLNKSMEKINKLQNTPIKYNNLDDKVDVSAQIGQVNNSYRDAVQGTRGLSDSRTAASMKGEFAANRIGAINPILENASNTSRGIRNQNVSNINTLNAVNAQRNDELSKYKLESQVGLNNAKIAGRNQAVDNIYQILREKNVRQSDKDQLILIMKSYNRHDTLNRADFDFIKKMGLNPADYGDTTPTK